MKHMKDEDVKACPDIFRQLSGCTSIIHKDGTTFGKMKVYKKTYCMIGERMFSTTFLEWVRKINNEHKVWEEGEIKNYRDMVL